MVPWWSPGAMGERLREHADDRERYLEISAHLNAPRANTGHASLRAPCCRLRDSGMQQLLVVCTHE